MLYYITLYPQEGLRAGAVHGARGRGPLQEGGRPRGRRTDYGSVRSLIGSILV